MLPSSASKPITTLLSTEAGASVHARQPGAGLPAKAVLAALQAYKLLISPLFTGCCRFQPSCADYMSEAVETLGAARGVWLGIRRLCRCQPFGGHGIDPVPRRKI